MKINWMVFIFAAAFFWMQNNYFGWNALPKSEAELICDGINMLLFSLAYL